MKEKEISDYYEKLYEKFPNVPKADIRRVVNYGWRLIYILTLSGIDIKLNNSNFFFLIGPLFKNSLLHFRNYVRKLKQKVIFLYKKRKTEWDGYYYFALSQAEYETYLAQMNKRGPKRKKFNFGRVKMYRIKEECILNRWSSKYIFRVKMPVAIYYSMTRELETKDAELIIKRDAMKMKDLLKENRTYGY